MNTAVKIWLITAGALTLLGIIIVFIVFAVNGFDLSFGKKTEMKTYEISQDFENISVVNETDSVTFEVSENGKCYIQAQESEKMTHTANVEDKTLYFKTEDNRQWLDHLIFFSPSKKVTIYLPKKDYSSLDILTSTGDINISNGLSFKNLDIQGSTSDITCNASIRENIAMSLSTGTVKLENTNSYDCDISLSTGDVLVSSSQFKNILKIHTTTGDILLSDISCKDLITDSSTGSQLFKKVIASNIFNITATTGDISFDMSDAKEITVKTSTGSVTGTLLTEKIFFTQTSTGDVKVPKTVSGGKCEITTNTGDIIIEIS